MTDPILEIENLSISFFTRAGEPARSKLYLDRIAGQLFR